MNWIGYTLIALALYAFGEYFSKVYANSGKLTVLLIGLVAYIGCTILWFPALKNNNKLIIMTTIWTIGYVVIGSAVGFVMFQEHLTVKQYIGFFMGAVSILLLCI